MQLLTTSLGLNEPEQGQPNFLVSAQQSMQIAGQFDLMYLVSPGPSIQHHSFGHSMGLHTQTDMLLHLQTSCKYSSSVGKDYIHAKKTALPRRAVVNPPSSVQHTKINS